MTLTINIWFLDDVCRKAGGIRCNGRDKCSDILRMMNFTHNSRYNVKKKYFLLHILVFWSFVLCNGRIEEIY